MRHGVEKQEELKNASMSEKLEVDDGEGLELGRSV